MKLSFFLTICVLHLNQKPCLLTFPISCLLQILHSCPGIEQSLSHLNKKLDAANSHRHDFSSFSEFVEELSSFPAVNILRKEHPFVMGIFTQGVLASKFPISIRTQPQGHDRCQKVQKILKNHVPISNFATMVLNLNNYFRLHVCLSFRRSVRPLVRHTIQF